MQQIFFCSEIEGSQNFRSELSFLKGTLRAESDSVNSFDTDKILQILDNFVIFDDIQITLFKMFPTQVE